MLRIKVLCKGSYTVFVVLLCNEALPQSDICTALRMQTPVVQLVILPMSCTVNCLTAHLKLSNTKLACVDESTSSMFFIDQDISEELLFTSQSIQAVF